jgi:hypothetical protein
MKARLKSFIKSSGGLNTVEVVIILAIVVGIALVFKDEIGSFVRGLLDSVFDQQHNFSSPVPPKTT